MRSGKSIICDDTVSGRGSFMYVTGMEEDFDAAFDAFLNSNRLLVTKEEGLWTVTKIRVDEETDGKISVISYDSTLQAVFEKISFRTGKSIIYENLPAQRASFNIKSQSVPDIVRLMLQPYAEYSVSESAAGVQIERRKSGNSNLEISTGGDAVCRINFSNGLYEVQIKNTKISEALEKLFVYSQLSYSDFLTGDEKIKSLSFTGKSLSESLSLILEQVNAESVNAGDVCYIFPSPQRTEKNSVAQKHRSWQLVNLRSISSSKIVPFITSKYTGVTVMELSSSQLGIYATEEEAASVTEYAARLEGGIESSPVYLKYIKTAELLNTLPPSVTKDEITDTGTGNSFFYTGSREKREQFLEQLKEIDIPKKLVRYDLLILQYEKSSSLTWGMSTSIRPSEAGDRTLVTGEVGNLLNINFDAITAFGLTFSEKINTAIQNNEASVFADTTLYGLSGEKISFKNTNTYRYKDAAIDSQSGKESFSTITREITSGLVLEIDGWVSGDGIITMQINTSVSKQGVDVSKKNGNPPPTSEKTITTKIRARNGEPVVLSGLSQTDLSRAEQGVPFLSKIPLLGNLFKSKDESKTKTEMTIYLLPHIEETPSEKRKESWKEILDGYLLQTEGVL